MLDALRRRWRMRGHGVHSPFAFRLVTTVLRDPGQYYAYPEIDRMAVAGGEDPRRLRLLFRLVCEFAPDTVRVDDTLTEARRHAILAADSRIRLTRGDAPVAVVGEAYIPPTGVVIARHADPALVAAPRDHGMIFTDGESAVIVMRPDLPPQNFDVIL